MTDGRLSRAIAMTIAGIVLSQPERVTRPSSRWPRATSSTESAIQSRLMSEAFMPSVPMAMPSVTEIVLNSIGVPPLARMPSATFWASLRWLELQGVSSIQQWAMPTSGRARSSSVKPTARKYERAAARSGPSSSARLLWRGSNAMILGLQVDRAVDAVADHVHALAVPGIRQPPVGQVRERDAGVRIGPAVGRADAAVAERARGGQRAETADGRRGAARVRTEAAVHGHAHVV